ncbi:MAG TPA: polysaccharide deacetylase family protein [Armatimonadota bacterium]|nr:polysaccharide deacetylase family protein [Armatimonadota bacterium]
MSHIAVHVAAGAMSHLGVHRPGLPPPALLIPLGNGIDGVLKGVRLADEARLIDALSRAQLHQQVLRVGVGEAAGARMALIKLQAGDRATGMFSLAETNEDAARALAAAFACPLQLQHVDLWSVVPGAEMIGDEQENLPVFSVSASRQAFEESDAAAQTPADLLEGLDAVRYSPLLLRYVDDATDDLPRSALAAPDMSESWDALVAQADTPQVRAAMQAQRQVTAIFKGDRVRPEVALTIDDGPHPLITPLMLQVLAREGVKATFFVVGQKCEQYPELVRMTQRAGHELANHAYSNRRLSELPADEAWAEVSACQRIVMHLTGEQMLYFRPPGGRCSPDGLRAVASLGCTVALWSRNTGDWRKPAPEVICANATNGLKAGDIILMHQGEMCSVEALPLIIRRVRELGLEPVTLGELGRNGGTVRDTPEQVCAIVNGTMLGHE